MLHVGSLWWCVGSSSLTRDQTQTLYIGSRVLTARPPRRSHRTLIGCLKVFVSFIIIPQLSDKPDSPLVDGLPNCTPRKRPEFLPSCHGDDQEMDQLEVSLKGLIEAKVVQSWIVHSRSAFRGLCIECIIQTLQRQIVPNPKAPGHRSLYFLLSWNGNLLLGKKGVIVDRKMILK